MYDANRVLHRLYLYTVHCDYDICLLMLLKCIAIYYSSTRSKKSDTMTLTGYADCNAAATIYPRLLQVVTWTATQSRLVTLTFDL